MSNKLFTIINYMFFSLIIVASVVLTIVFKLNWLTLISCVSSIFYIVFLSDRNLLNFIVGFISSTTYIFVAFQAKIYGEVIFYLIIDLPMIFISYFMWKKNLESSLRVNAQKMSFKQILITLLISIVAIALYSLFLNFIGGVNCIVDAISTVSSLIATILMAKRYREQWFMWIVVYIVSVVMWILTFDLLMLIMSISCLSSSLIGYFNWSINANKHKPITSTGKKNK